MAEVLRHIGRIAKTDQKVVVVMMQLLPDNPKQCLIMSMDNIPERIEQLVVDALRSPEGRTTENLWDVLDRRVMPDNAGVTLAKFLHLGGFLRAVDVTSVYMEPIPNHKMLLSDILIELKRLPRNEDEAETKYNQYLENQTASNVDEVRRTAINILIEADLLQSEADAKRSRAYQICPDLNPAFVAPTKPTKAVAKPATPAPAKSVAKKPVAKAPAKKTVTKKATA